ncbi:MAG: hypothetical protein IJR65_00695 [Oscillospiraceae bacterium]|nr:hypothetical protein [Oscillospiraceae bacterium]
MNKKKTEQNKSVHNILWFALSLLAAVLLWVYVTENEGQEITVPLPGVQVSFNGESTMRENREMIVSDVSTTSVTVTVTGSRRVVSAMKASDLSAVIDLNNITRTGSNSRVPEIKFSSRTDMSAITTVTTDPDVVNFYVDKLAKRTVELVGVFNGSAAEGYSAEPLVFSPSTVIVYGPEKVLNTIKSAYVEVTRTDVDHTLSFESTYVLIDAEGAEVESDELTFSESVVNVTLPILAVKEVGLTIELTAGGGATESNVRWKLEPATIILSGDAEVLSGVNSIPVARIDLSLVDEPLTETYRIELPNNTELTSGTRETTLTLEVTGLYSELFTIEGSNISVINVSEGFTAEVMNSSLTDVVIRGPEEVLKNLSNLNIRAVADLRNYGTATGIVSVPVKISINGTTEAGAVGEYSVYVNIVEQEKAPAEEGEDGP